jgi:putative MFS transporter
MYVAFGIYVVGLWVTLTMAPETGSMDLHHAGSLSH